MNIRNTKKTYVLNEKNKYKEHFQFNQKERNVKNIVFVPRQLFRPMPELYGPTPTTRHTPKFGPHRSSIQATHATNAI